MDALASALLASANAFVDSGERDMASLRASLPPGRCSSKMLDLTDMDPAAAEARGPFRERWCGAYIRTLGVQRVPGTE